MKLSNELRDAGFGVTVINGEGMQGEVAILWCVTPRKKLKKVINLVEKVCQVEMVYYMCQNFIHQNV